MPIARMIDGVPIVQDHKGEVAAWAHDEGDQIGFILPPAGAVTLANRLLAIAEDIDPQATLSIPVRSVELQRRHDDSGEERLCLVFTNISGTTTRCDLDATQLAELIADCTAKLAAMDRPKPPRMDGRAT